MFPAAAAPVKVKAGERLYVASVSSKVARAIFFLQDCTAS